MMALLTEKAERIRRRELHRALTKLPDISDKEAPCYGLDESHDHSQKCCVNR